MKQKLFITICLLGLWVAVQAAPIARVANCGAVVTIKAEPKTGYQFDKWSDGNTENPREIEISALSTVEPYTATFKSSTPTALEGTDAEEPRVRKVMIEDKLYIIYGDKMYDARGVLVQ